MRESSSTYNATTQLASTYQFMSLYMNCIVSRPTSSVFATYNIIIICLHLPLSLFILHHGRQRWNKRSTSSAASTTHSDCFTYHLASMELIGVAGCAVTFCAIYKKVTPRLLEIGVIMYTFTWFGEIFFHILTCLERYLAVVHPIVYLNLRKRSWIRIRNLITGGVWLLCILLICLVSAQLFFIINFCTVIISIAVISFCNLSVLNALIHPRLGDQGGGPDQLKKRAFYTIMAILGVLMLRFAFGLSWAVLFAFGQYECVTMTIDGWFNLPSSLVLQLLFLHRTDNFVCKRISQ